MDYKKLGILGGMGPLATYTLYKNIIESTPAEKDQDHINMTILNASYIPDRTCGILHGGESPLPYLLDGCKRLENDGCDLIAIPCNTSHYFYDELQNSCKSRILNMIDLTADYIVLKNIKRVYLMATEGTIKTGVYQNYFSRKNIEIIPPNTEETAEMMRVIYSEIKAGKPADLNKLEKYALSHECVTVLGCTEFSAVKFKNIEYADAMDVLKDKILELFLKK